MKIYEIEKLVDEKVNRVIEQITAQSLDTQREIGRVQKELEIIKRQRSDDFCNEAIEAGKKRLKKLFEMSCIQAGDQEQISIAITATISDICQLIDFQNKGGVLK